MNKKSLFANLLVSICFLLAGIIFIAFCSSQDVYTIVETALGIVFIVPSILYVCLVMARHREQRGMTDYVGIVPAVGGLCFGVVLVLKPDLFIQALSIVFAVLLIVLGMFHLVYMAISGKRAKIVWWYYLAPLAVAVAGIVLLLKGDIRAEQATMVLVVGIAFVLTAATTVLEMLGEWQASRARKRAEAAIKPAEALDVEPAAKADDTPAPL